MRAAPPRRGAPRQRCAAPPGAAQGRGWKALGMRRGSAVQCSGLQGIQHAPPLPLACTPPAAYPAAAAPPQPHLDACCSGQPRGSRVVAAPQQVVHQQAVDAPSVPLHLAGGARRRAQRAQVLQPHAAAGQVVGLGLACDLQLHTAGDGGRAKRGTSRAGARWCGGSGRQSTLPQSGGPATREVRATRPLPACPPRTHTKPTLRFRPCSCCSYCSSCAAAASALGAPPPPAAFATPLTTASTSSTVYLRSRVTRFRLSNGTDTEPASSMLAMVRRWPVEQQGGCAAECPGYRAGSTRAAPSAAPLR